MGSQSPAYYLHGLGWQFNFSTGFFLGIGGGLHKSSPLSLFLGYAIASTFGFMMMMALREMAARLPVPGAIPQLH